MDAWLSDDQISLRDGLREVLKSTCPPDVVRAVWEKGIGAHEPRRLWQTLADLGLFGLLAAADLGGGDGNEVDLVVMMEECGRAAAPGPLLEQIAVGVPALATAPGKLVEQAISGSAVITAQESDGARVPWAVDADVIVAVQPDGVAFATRDAVTVSAAPESVDKSRQLNSVEFAKTTELPGVRADTVFNRAALAAAAQLLGLADHLIRAAVDYALVRHQFGVPIGSQRPVQHMLASAYIELQHARPVVYEAARVMAADLDTTDREVSFAKVYAHRAAHTAARAALQCHGAIGYTWEHDLQLWIKRVWALGSVWGTDTFHQDRVSRLVLDAGSEPVAVR
ncbi:acyl-CoA dehydrogenase family protein [Mycolicibacterium vinylchloridicum]|uniref:acyl-CoA dehydrogenase family protein n=1 Tax=Mycolicibacterium vinylchloridicum TaxID=2736928 RepID=UPI0015C8F877|nr:acyl-CoA dehydrogenase family protein [Mycolicibacterium vinylchloridicum]